ncbi:hypothetical protein K1T71_014767 [Dendrolimus kikuchii]|nr:hypothetical protein K1T71_014767 [Dendrolimus kikuchii]
MSQQVFHPSLFNRPRSSSLSNLVQFSKTTSTETPQSEIENQLQNILQDTSSEQKPPPPWQKVPTSRSQKKRKANKSPTIGETTPIKNRYNNLPVDAADDTIVNAIPKIQKPPPIVLYGVQDVNELSKLLESACNKTDFKLKIVNKTLLRVLVDSPESYKKVITLVRDNGLIGHTFTPKNLRSYRIVIKDLHHSTPHSAIMEAIEKTGNMVRGEIINARSGPEKMPTSTFFVNLEPNPNNKAVKNIDYIFHQKVIIEDPRKSTSIVQCHRCQQYGHSKNNCMRPYRCVKCGKGHRTSDCPKKDKNTPATCALCTLDHPANYKGCLIYKEIVARRNKSYYQKSRTQNQPMVAIPIPAPLPAPDTEAVTFSQETNDKPNNGHALDIGCDNGIQNRKTYAASLKQPRLHKKYEISEQEDPEKEYKQNKSIEMLLIKQNEKFELLLQQMSNLMNLITTLVNKLI